MCSTKALLGGDADEVSNIFRDRVMNRDGKGAGVFGWATAYGKGDAKPSAQGKVTPKVEAKP